jgi:hypothetical protein
MQRSVHAMLAEAIECEQAFAQDMTSDGVPGPAVWLIYRTPPAK